MKGTNLKVNPSENFFGNLPGISSYLIVISAPSGAGKTTLCKRLLDEFPTVTLSISSTTRPPRGKEKNSVDYFFLTRAEFESKIQAGEFVEWAKVHDNYYGTSKTTLQSALSRGQSVLLDIDVQGADQLKAAFPKDCYRVFISPPNLNELEKRLRARGTDSEETIQTRLKNAQIEMDHAKSFDKIIVNDSLDRAYSELRLFLIHQLQLPVKHA